MNRRNLLLWTMGPLLIVSLFEGCRAEKQEARPVVTQAAVDVEELIGHPEKYRGKLKVEGTVTEVVDSASAFLLGCADECIAMPVEYHGRLPKRGALVQAAGEVRKGDDGKLIFAAEEVLPK